MAGDLVEYSGAHLRACGVCFTALEDGTAACGVCRLTIFFTNIFKDAEVTVAKTQQLIAKFISVEFCSYCSTFRHTYEYDY